MDNTGHSQKFLKRATAIYIITQVTNANDHKLKRNKVLLYWDFVIFSFVLCELPNLATFFYMMLLTHSKVAQPIEIYKYYQWVPILLKNFFLKTTFKKHVELAIECDVF